MYVCVCLCAVLCCRSMCAVDAYMIMKNEKQANPYITNKPSVKRRRKEECKEGGRQI